MSRKSPAGKTGPPRFEAGPQGSSAFLFARTMPFFQNAPLRRFRRKKPGNRPCFPTKNRKRLRASTPRRHGAAPKNANSGGMPAPGAKKNAAARVSPKPRHRSPHGTKKFRPARKEVPSAQLRCAEGRSLRPSGGIAGRPAFPVPRRNFRGTLAARRRLSPHRRTASPRFAGFRPAGISLVSTRAAFLSGGTVRAEIAAHPPRPCRTFLRDSLSHPCETPRPAPSPALSRSLRSARVGDTSCPR